MTAGILLQKKAGHHVKAGDVLFTVYAEKEWKLTQAIGMIDREPPLVVSGMILESSPTFQVL